jgi:hypothetical protein
VATPDEVRRLAGRYTAFAGNEARGSCEIYERLSLEIAGSPELLEFLLTLPAARRQPNLFLAAMRYMRGVPENAAGMAELVHRDGERLRALMLSRTTQTNEPARCAALLPVLAQLPPPLALIEVGASAGLCLLPDRYGYDYGASRIDPADPAAPIFPCRTTGPVPLPSAVPRIVWRRGLDLDPVDLESDEEVAWLETLVWPGQDDRTRRLRAAIEIARCDPPQVVKGDLLSDLEPLMAEAPRDATLVVFHTAVFPYVTPQECRDQFAERMLNSAAVWIGNEAPNLFRSLAKAAPPAPRAGLFLLMRDGVPFAWAGAHGQSLDWFAER